MTFADMLSTRRCVRNVERTRDLRLPSGVVTSSPIPRHIPHTDSASQKRCAPLSHVALILISAQTPCRRNQPTGRPMHRVHSARSIEPGVDSVAVFDAISQVTYGNHQSLPQMSASMHMLIQHRLARHNSITFSPSACKRSPPSEQFVDLQSGVGGTDVKSVGNKLWLNELSLGFVDCRIVSKISISA